MSGRQMWSAGVRGLGPALWFAGGIAAWVLVWWGLVRIFTISPDFLPAPADVLARVLELVERSVGEGPLHVHIQASLVRFVSGFGPAILVAVPLGMLMASIRAIDWLVTPVFELVRYVPPIAWAPFALLWFGTGGGAEAFVIFISTLPPILINAYRAVKLVDPDLVRAARTLGAGAHTLLLEVALPASVPMLVAGLRIGVATGWMALIAAEIVAGAGSRAGLGYLILVGQQTLQASITIGAMLLIGLLGWALDAILRQIETYAMRWR